MSEQLRIDVRTCKEAGCTEDVVGHSTTGKGYVCKRHNEIEWGRALRKHDPEMSRVLLAGGAFYGR